MTEPHICPWCKGDDLLFHCVPGRSDCAWVKCPDCKLTIDPIGHRAVKASTGELVPWPHSLPD